MAALSHDPLPTDDVASVDKTIVDRRARHRSSGSRIAMRNARREMQTEVHEPSRFREELLQLHAKRIIASRWPMFGLCLFLATVLALLLNVHGQVAVTVWSLLALIAFAANEWCARRYLSRLAAGRPLAGATSHFTVVQALHGLVWALFILLAHPYFTNTWTAQVFASPGLPGPFLLGTLLLVGSCYLVAAHALVAAMAWVCLLPFLSIAILLAPAAGAGDGSATSSLLGAATLCVIFSLLGARLRDYARGNVRARMEKDHAVLESEEARNLSEEARRRAEEANMAKTRFLATMSHELRTPLNAILGFSEIMEQEVLGPLGNEKYREYVTDIHVSGSHLLKLINEILDLSRIEAGRYELHEEAIDLAALASDAMQMVKLKANEKNLALQIRAERTLPRVWADAQAVRQVVLNLLSNAVKFTPKGGRVTVKVGWTGNGGQYVSITDSGPGIADEELPVVMAAFGQGSVALRTAEPGSGLGLPIVQAFMDMHDGRLDIQSKLREGTTVTAFFPRKRVLADELANHRAKTKAVFAKAS